jgi:acyl-CoA reductase-like NAD-dependent aldehyde dehydrogenase
MRFETLNPSTGEILRAYTFHNERETDQILASSMIAFAGWRDMRVDARAEKLLALSDVLLKKRDALAALMTAEMGKLIAESKAEIEKCAGLARYYAEHGPAFLKNEIVAALGNGEYLTDPSKNPREAYVTFEPLGPILAVMPWNYPFWQVMRFSIPTLLAGNTVLLKHAPNVQGSALAIEEAFLEAGFPSGVFQNLILPVPAIEAVVKDSRVRGVTLTGSPNAGMTLAAQAGHALKKCVLELGGADAFIVLADADVKKAAIAAVKSRFSNAGQVCIAAKRFIVVESVADAFTEHFLSAMKSLRAGNPMDPNTTLAPLARADLREGLDKQVQASVSLGAKLVWGGRKVPGPGFFYEPTLLTHATPEMPIYNEDTFGPVATLFRVPDTKSAIVLANATPYGLSSALWTSDLENAKHLAGQIEAGAVFINDISKSDPRIPIGGVKRSGFGRELSHFGIREFVNVKSVWSA